jgi:hypothetical protein
MARIGRNEPCPCGSGRKYKRCCIDKPASVLADGDPSGATAATGNLTLVIETDDGVIVRNVVEASPLRRDVAQGQAAEEAAQDAAAVWGLPDFVYRGGHQRVGSGVRELGDGIVVVGDLGLVVQVKSREATVGDTQKERRWIKKSARQAISQGRGTIRKLRERPIILRNFRDIEVELDAQQIEWTVVVVIDHPAPPANVAISGIDGFGDGVAVVLRRDWEFLFEQLKSTRAVAGYFKRTAGEDIALCDEPTRYYNLAAADKAAKPTPIDTKLLGDGARGAANLLLPMEPAGDSDRPGHLVMRSILEDVAVAPAASIPWEQRLQILADLDFFPVAERAAIGTFLIENLHLIARTGGGATAWRFRRFVSTPAPERLLHLAFGVCNVYDELRRAAFQSWVELRHYDLVAKWDHPEAVTTIGVMLTPRYDGQRPWDTTALGVTGPLQLSEKELTEYRRLWKEAAVPVPEFKDLVATGGPTEQLPRAIRDT